MEATGGPHIDSLSFSSAAGDADEITRLLDVLTEAQFDPVSGWIVAWVNTECDKDVRKLRQAAHLVFERAKDAPSTRSALYARLCRKMMEQISPNVRDESTKDVEGRPIGGGQLFRKYLLNWCQEDFEHGWIASEVISAAAAQRARRQGLGLIRFICELFKLQMLSERIIHKCVKKLLGNVEHPEEEEIESLCTLLTTVGHVLDTPKARADMDVYFSRMKELKKSGNVNSRMQYMLQEIIELRERKWIPRNRLAAPMSQTIAAVYKQAAKEKLARENEAFTRQVSMSPGGSRRGGERGDHAQIGPDGWAVSGGAAPRPPSKAGDLSKYGKIDKSAPMTFSPSSVFQKGDKSTSSEPIIRQGNTFSTLSVNQVASEVTGQSRRPPNRGSSIDLGPGGVPDGAAPPHRRKLQLLPSSVPLENKSELTPSASPVDWGEEPSGISSLFEAEAKIRIEKDSNEFFSTRDLQEAKVYFTKFPSKHQHLLVDKLVNRAIESKQADAQLVADLFDRAVSRNLCSPASFEEGFIPTAEIIDDIVIDAPNALDLFAIMIKGAHLDEDEERLTRLASKSMDSDKLIALLS